MPAAASEPPKKIGVAIAPGEMVFTRMPWTPSCTAAMRAACTTAALATE